MRYFNAHLRVKYELFTRLKKKKNLNDLKETILSM